jgi:putative 4-mercaptohistidine N1-methyltranferase
MSSAGKIVRSTAASGSQIYESSRAVSEYIQFHFGEPTDLMPYSFGPKDALNFPQRTADICKKYAGKQSSVLDIGCAVGGASFELSKHFDRVVGIDFSQHFVDAAITMKDTKTLHYEMLKQGNIFLKKTAILPADIDVSKVSFLVGDACNLDAGLGSFDVIHASNLLCRLPNPRKFLDDIPRFLNPGGVLVLVSPYSWLEEYTSKEHWIGAAVDAGGVVKESYAEVEGILSKNFSMLDEMNVPFLIREHERKFQYGVSDCMIWRKL